MSNSSSHMQGLPTAKLGRVEITWEAFLNGFATWTPPGLEKRIWRRRVKLLKQFMAKKRWYDVFGLVSPIAKLVGCTEKAGLSIFLQDISTSMAEAGDAICAAQRPLLDAARAARRTWLFQVGVASRFYPILPAPADLRDMQQLYPGQFHHASPWHPHGILRAGSALSTALLMAGNLAKAYRLIGGAGPIVIQLVTDGWNRNSAVVDDPGRHAAWAAQTEAMAAASLTQARLFGATISVTGFVKAAEYPRFEQFAKSVGLRDDEVSVVSVSDRATLGQSVERAYRRAGALTQVSFVG